jgi:hydrogenase nickel incorporation protein HypA/HybF
LKFLEMGVRGKALLSRRAFPRKRIFIGRTARKTMHEMGIVQSIMEIIEQQAALHGARRVTKVCLEFGALTGVMPSAVDFAFEVLSKDSIADGAELNITIIPIKGVCRECGKEVTLDGYQPLCPACSTGILNIIEGRDEMRISTLEIEDSPE